MITVKPLPAEAALMFASRASARAVRREIEAGKYLALVHGTEHLAQVHDWMTRLAAALDVLAVGAVSFTERELCESQAKRHQVAALLIEAMQDGHAAPTTPVRFVTVPAFREHEGQHAMSGWLPWRCRECLGPRGEPCAGFSYDGSRRLAVSCWENPCGHHDAYEDVRRELVELHAIGGSHGAA